MEESKQSLNKMEIERRIQLLRSKNVSEEVIKLVRSDLEDGLTEEQTDIYMNKNLNIDQMKALSSCLHKGIPDEMIALLKENNLSGNQMCVSLEFYEKGVPIDAIKEIIVRGDNTIAMRSAYSKILENMEQMKKESEKAPEYVEELVEQIRDMVGKIHHQEERYDALNKKLALIETNKGDEEVMNRLVKENSDKDAMIESQQNELNKANGTIARLRDDIEKKDKEMVRMSNRIESLEDKIMSVATQTEAAKESKIVEEPVKSESAKTAEDVAANQKLAEDKKIVPIYYQIPVVDASGHMIQRAFIDRNVRKGGNGVAGLFSKLSFKKKSRADIVKLLASGELVPAQLCQIKSAIEKGLTESQLIELINNNVSAEKMKEIIEIAVLENSIAY
ncbi:hypothetical protein FYJ75_08815 [Roseburia sp. MUC/MUC-530-WT-4D]|uniref:Membrane-bound metallopeptidase n=1 Tax=Roseburia porci TaxID=2605790 RepID=A0A6L5YT35_9FIRM|nr:hypothetical protein [Roseburia porci]MST75126.1 hypothetical protein [Roseburia porci]